MFAVGAGTEVLIWSHGVPHVGSTADLHQGDFVTVRIRAPRGSTLQTIVGTPAATVADRAGTARRACRSGCSRAPSPARSPAARSPCTSTSGNWKALQAMLGQPLDQSFAYDDGTIFLLWQGNVPTVIDPSQLQAGDRITVRIRAPRAASLAQVEATAANHVGDHEPPPPPED